jgi:hypothetical protein
MERQISTVPANGRRARVTATEAPPALSIRAGCAVITQLPACVNMELYAGDSFTLRIDVTDGAGDPADLSGAVIRAQIRTTPESTNIAGQFTPTIQGSAILLDLTSEVSTRLPARTVWDVDMTRGDRVITLAAGTITLTPEVSR